MAHGACAPIGPGWRDGPAHARHQVPAVSTTASTTMEAQQEAEALDALLGKSLRALFFLEVLPRGGSIIASTVGRVSSPPPTTLS